MHFPRFVLKSFIIGAALCFPSVALADKADHVSPSMAKKSMSADSNVKTNGNERNHSLEHMRVEANKAHQISIHTQRSFPKQAKAMVKTIKNVEEKKITHVKNVVNETDPGLKIGHLKDRTHSSVIQHNQPELHHPPKPDVEEKSQSSIEPKRKRVVSIVSKPSTATTHQKESIKSKQSFTKKVPDSNKLDPTSKKREPSSKESLPKDIQFISTTFLGSNNSTSSAKDRSNSGTSTINFAVWIDLEKYRSPSFSRFFTSRSYELNNQWTNAPPIQPPKSFLF